MLLTTGCRSDDGDVGSALGRDGAAAGADGSQGSPAARLTPQQRQAREQRVLDQRARAVREADLALFLRSVDRRDRAFVARQRRYFANLVQLPLQRFDYRVLPQQWDVTRRPGWGRDAQVPQVDLTMQLRDLDTRPVRRTVGFAFTWAGGRPRIVSDRGAAGERMYAGAPAPWDLTAVTVRQRPGVLGVFDARTAPSADLVMSAVEQGISEVDDALPFTWPGKVVVYSVRDSAVLDSFTDVPGGSIDLLGAMTFPTYAAPESSPVASTRMLVMAGSVAAGQPFLGRIVRHELSHVALGTRDDGAPTWLSEGLAEYLGARSVPRAQRIIPSAAVARARGGDPRLPVSGDFNGPDQEWNYALSWMAVDHLAATEGEDRVWDLVAALHAGGRGTPDDAQDGVLRRVVGLDSDELARRAAARIRSLYG